MDNHVFPRLFFTFIDSHRNNMPIFATGKEYDNQMAKKKKKQQGHYCRVCGGYKANEKFSGKGYAQHICKSCMSAMRSGKNGGYSARTVACEP